LTALIGTHQTHMVSQN